jgi:transcriptional regulator of arginine metabolism
MDPAENLLIIKTLSGMAMAVAAALDDLEVPGIVGCIAGDDTVMCAVRSVGEVPQVMNRINKLLKEENTPDRE